MPLCPQITNTPTVLPRAVSITGVTFTSTTATYAAAGHTFIVGDVVVTSDLAPVGYNGTFTVTSIVASTSFTVANTTNAAVTDSNGLAVPGGNYVVSGIVPVVAATTTQLDAVDLTATTANTNANTAITNAAFAVTAAGNAQTTADGKNRIYRQATQPTGGTYVTGDVWYDTSTGYKPYTYQGPITAAVTTKALTSNVATLTTLAAHGFTTGQSVTVTGVDATFNGTYSITVTTTTQFTYAKTATNVTSTAVTPNGSAVQAAFWQTVQDASIATALSAANAAQTTANGKNKITYSASTPGTTANTAGDLWWQFSGGTVIAQWTGAGGTSWTSNQLANAVIASLDAGKITAGTINVAISLSAATITGGSINIGAGVFVVSTAGVVTITAGSLNISSGTFAVSAAGAVTATSGTIGGWTLTSTQLYTGTLASPNQYLNSAGGALFTGTTTCSALGVNSNLTVGGTGTVTGVFTAVDAGTVTNTNAANTWLSTGGVLRRTTASSLRYKENVADIASVNELHPKKLLDLPVRAFTYKEGYLPITDDRYGTIFPGFISEEVDAVYPVAADYENGQIESWNHRMVVPALLWLIQDQEARIKTLEDRGA